jgi:CHAT domain-containing protein
LVVSPHKELHAIPWAALTVEASAKMLVQSCIPVVTPSIQSLMMLWRRDEAIPIKPQNGLAIGLSSFGERRRELPHVKDEITFLSSKLGADGVCLAESDASWKNLIELNQTSVNGKRRGLSRFDWMHIASHFFSHAQTGRLSGLALYDGDVWLDSFRDLSPLPKLVTLSACNSISSFVYDGEEHVDLPSTCLIAGAQNVVGSIWPVLDNAAAGFTSRFYSHHLNGMSPAQALAKSQRELLDRGAPVSEWAGFQCIGAV